jgi:hypothetical protein
MQGIACCEFQAPFLVVRANSRREYITDLETARI